jgi:RHS repeat-associated protein
VESGETDAYTYDNVGRMVSASQQRGASTHDYHWTYDAAGNRLTQRLDGTTTVSTYDAASRLVKVGSVGYSYDAAGRLTSDGVDQYHYDGAGRLTSIVGPHAVQLEYNGDGNLVRSIQGGTATSVLLDAAGGMPTQVATTRAGATTRFITGVGPVAELSAIGATLFEHADASGSIRLVTSSAGAVVDSSTYDPFGVRLSGTSALGFDGEPSIVGTGLLNLRARDYVPTSGRFLTTDAASPSIGDPQSIDPYTFAGNNPVNLTDPTGLCWFNVCEAVSNSFNAVGNAAQTAWKTTQHVAAQVGAAVVSTYNSAAATAGALATGAGNAIAAGAQSVAQGAAVIAAGAGNAIATGAQSLAQGAAVIAGGAGNLIAGGAGNLAQSASVIAGGAGNLIAGGAGNLVQRASVIAAGAGNWIAAGAGNLSTLAAGILAGNTSNLIAGGAGNILAGNTSNLIAGGAGNILAGNTSNLIAGGAGNLIAGGAGNLIAGGAGN